MAGYEVETSQGLRLYRDATLASISDTLTDAQHLIAAAAVPAGAWPAAASNARADHAAAVDAMGRTVQDLNDTTSTHIDAVTRTATTYDAAEHATAASVAHVAGASVGASPAETTVRPPSSPAATPTPTPTASPTAVATASPDEVLALYGVLKKLCAPLGLAGAIEPIGRLVAGNVRDPGPFVESANGTAALQGSAERMSSTVTTGLDRLAGYWTGPAQAAHQQATMDSYGGGLTTLAAMASDQTHASLVQADKQHWYNGEVARIIVGTIFAVIAAWGLLTSLAVFLAATPEILTGLVLIILSAVNGIVAASLFLDRMLPGEQTMLDIIRKAESRRRRSR